MYLEPFRDGTFASEEQVRMCKEVFEQNGIHVSGGITTAMPDPEGAEPKQRMFGTLCYNDEAMIRQLEAVAEMNGRLFDQWIIDDFYFTNCTCDRCRAERDQYNAEHGIVPRGVKKEIRDIIDGVYRGPDVAKPASRRVEETDFGALDEKSLSARLKELEARMMDFARNLDFEKAAQVREEIKHLREQAFGASAEA